MSLVYVSIGSNIDRYQHVTAALDALIDHFGELKISNVYESEAIGFEGDSFLNLVVGFETDLAVGELAAVLRLTEDVNGRCRGGPKFGPRTLDIDIITYGDVSGVVDGVELPRDEVTKNAFVLLPLMEVAAEEIHPVLNISYQRLWEAFDKNSQKLWPVDFEWGGNRISVSL